MNSRLRFSIAAVLATATIALWFYFKRDARDESAVLRTVAMKVLAEHLLRTFPSQRVLVLANPFILDARQPKSIRMMEEASLRGLKQVLGEAKLAVAFPQLRPGARENPQAFLVDPETTTPLSFLVAPDAIDVLAKEHADCKVIISLIGLPVELNRVTAWLDPAGPKFALLLPDLRMLGNAAAVAAAMNSGKLVAIVLNKPGAKLAELSPKGDARAVFDQHFILATPDNIEALIRNHPKLFESSGGLAR